MKTAITSVIIASILLLCASAYADIAAPRRPDWEDECQIHNRSFNRSFMQFTHENCVKACNIDADDFCIDTDFIDYTTQEDLNTCISECNEKVKIIEELPDSFGAVKDFLKQLYTKKKSTDQARKFIVESCEKLGSDSVCVSGCMRARCFQICDEKTACINNYKKNHPNRIIYH